MEDIFACVTLLRLENIDSSILRMLDIDIYWTVVNTDMQTAISRIDSVNCLFVCY